MMTKLDADARHRIEVRTLETLDGVLQELKRQGRVQFWQRADTGYVCDAFLGTRQPRPKEIGFRIDAHVGDDGSVKVTVKNVFAQNRQTIEAY